MKKADNSKRLRTDWKRVDALKDEDIDLSDTPEVPAEMFARAVARRGLKPAPRKAQISDAEFRRQLKDIAEWRRKHLAELHAKNPR